MVFSLAQPPRPLEKQPQDACLTSLFRVSGSRALKHTQIPAPVGRNGQVHRRQSTPRLVGVIAHSTSPPTHPEVTQPPELPSGPRPPRPPPLKKRKKKQCQLYPSSLPFSPSPRSWARQDELRADIGRAHLRYLAQPYRRPTWKSQFDPLLSHLPHSRPICPILDAVSWFARNLEPKHQFVCHMLDKHESWLSAVPPSKTPTSLLLDKKQARSDIHTTRKYQLQHAAGAIWKVLRVCFAFPTNLCWSHCCEIQQLLEASLHHCPCMTQIVLSGRSGQKRGSDVGRPPFLPNQPAESQQKKSLPHRVDAVAKSELPGRIPLKL